MDIANVYQFNSFETGFLTKDETFITILQIYSVLLSELIILCSCQLEISLLIFFISILRS